MAISFLIANLTKIFFTMLIKIRQYSPCEKKYFFTRLRFLEKHAVQKGAAICPLFRIKFSKFY